MSACTCLPGLADEWCPVHGRIAEPAGWNALEDEPGDLLGFTVGSTDVKRCPALRMDPGHFRPDGSCRCVGHRPRVTRSWASATRSAWSARCSCGWAGPVHLSRDGADADALAHEISRNGEDVDA